jgi:hypothetical protein
MDCDFTFVCDKEWYELRLLAENEIQDLGIFPEVRHCISCKKNVFKVETEEQLRIALKNGHCICIGKFDKQKKKWMNRSFQTVRTMGLLSPPSGNIDSDK